MKIFVVLLSFAAFAVAADPQTETAKNPAAPQGEQVKRLGSLTWDMQRHKLIWKVQSGVLKDGDFVPDAEQLYEISPDEAVMAVSQEKRGFDTSEAATLQQLLDVLTVYCAESVVWWDEGLGKPVGPAVRPPSAPRQEQPGENARPEPVRKPVKVGQPAAPPKPAYHVPDSDLVAQRRPVQ